MSPKRLEYLVNGYFGTVGMYTLGLSDLAVRAMMDEPPRPEMRLDDMPIIKSFYRVDPARATVFESDLYKMREQVNEAYSSVEALKKEGNFDAADKAAERDQASLDARETIQAASQQLAKLNKWRNEIYADRNMTPEEKRAELDAIQVERNAVAKDAMTDEVVKAAQ
jgi:hypothetical protein